MRREAMSPKLNIYKTEERKNSRSQGNRFTVAVAPIRDIFAPINEHRKSAEPKILYSTDKNISVILLKLDGNLLLSPLRKCFRKPPERQADPYAGKLHRLSFRENNDSGRSSLINTHLLLPHQESLVRENHFVLTLSIVTMTMSSHISFSKTFG